MQDMAIRVSRFGYDCNNEHIVREETSTWVLLFRYVDRVGENGVDNDSFLIENA